MARPAEVTAPQQSPAEWRDPFEPGLSAILSHSLDAFSEQGYAATSVRDIANRVGVTVPTLYYHHQNKEGILWALLDVSINRLHAMCQAALAESTVPAVRFGNVVRCLTVYVASTPKLAALDFEIRSLTARNRRSYVGRRARVEKLLVDAIADGVAAGAFDVADADATGRALLGMIQAVTFWYRPERDGSYDDLARRYLAIAARTVGARKAALSAIVACADS